MQKLAAANLSRLRGIFMWKRWAFSRNSVALSFPALLEGCGPWNFHKPHYNNLVGFFIMLLLRHIETNIL